MKYLKIQNRGVLDIRLVALMGGTTKSKDKFKIGQFGTGLKYSLAYLLRNNIDFHIFVGESEVKITTITENIANEDFDIIHIDGVRTSITTNMGDDWKAWMIIREIWCNALDEGGVLKEETDELKGCVNATTFYIQITPEFRSVLDEWNVHFIHESQPMESNDKFAVYPNTTDKTRLYKNGVLIKTYRQHSVFHYDIKDADINELREYTGSQNWDIGQILNKCSSRTIEYLIENVKDESVESDINFDWTYEKMGDGWKDAIGEASIITEKSVDNLKSKGVEIDTSKMVVVPENFYKQLNKQFKGMSALRTASKLNEFFEIHDESMLLLINKAITILESCNYDINPELKIITGIFGDKNVLGSINFDNKEIFISSELKKKSMFDMVTTLVEEYEHFNTGFEDCTRSFQQHFIDMYTKQMLNVNGIDL